MADILEGMVTDVVDGEMLELKVDRVVARGRERYSAQEVVRLAGLPPARTLDTEAAAHRALDYQDQRVRCYIDRRDPEGRLIARVEILSGRKSTDSHGMSEEGE